MIPQNKKNTLKPDFVTSTIISREEEYIMMTKKELQMVDRFNTDMNVFAEVATVLGSTGLGFLLNLEPTLTKSYAFIVLFTLVMIGLGIYAKFAKKDTVDKILKLYQK